MENDGNLRSSHREMSQLKLKHASSSLHDLIQQFVETRVKDCCIRQRLQTDKETIVKRGTFYVLENESKAEPGFLIFLPGQPAVFTTMRGKASATWMMRMRVDVTLAEGGGTMLIATLDKIQHTMRFEDVWIWKGEELATCKTYSQRRQYLKDFVEKCWTPDPRLMGGITCTVANPKPLASVLDSDNFHSMELIPELPGRRRFWFLKEEPVAPVYQAPAPAALSVQKEMVAQANRMNVYAVALESLPDVYDLFLENGTPLCRAAVQQLALSQQLRGKKGKIPVIAEWKAEFGRYEIVAVPVA